MGWIVKSIVFLEDSRSSVFILQFFFIILLPSYYCCHPPSNDFDSAIRQPHTALHPRELTATTLLTQYSFTCKLCTESFWDTEGGAAMRTQHLLSSPCLLVVWPCTVLSLVGQTKVNHYKCILAFLSCSDSMSPSLLFLLWTGVNLQICRWRTAVHVLFYFFISLFQGHNVYTPLTEAQCIWMWFHHVLFVDN